MQLGTGVLSTVASSVLVLVLFSEAQPMLNIKLLRRSCVCVLQADQGVSNNSFAESIPAHRGWKAL